MQHYMFHPVALLRSPAYPFSHIGTLSLQQHLDTTYFRNALFIAAPALFQEIAKAGFHAGSLRPKALKALWNYLNRLYYRSTPFGMFSGFAAVRWQTEHTAAIPVVFNERHLHVIEPVTDKAIALPLAAVSSDTLLLFANPSVYKAGSELRFLKSRYDDGGHGYQFHIAAIAEHRLLRLVLKYCTQPIDPIELSNRLKEQLPLTDHQLYQTLSHLVSEGLLLWKRHDSLVHARKARQIVLPGSELREADFTGIVGNCYTTLHFELKEGNIAAERQISIRQGLDALNALCPHIEPPGLERFAADFTTKFEGRAMPLMEALDPELGVGYRGLEKSYDPPLLLDRLVFPKKAATVKQLRWSAAHAALLNKIQAAADLRKKGIVLDEDDLGYGKEPKKPLPPGMSVLFRPLHDQVFIESAGGATATALFGRFSIFDRCLADTLRTIADNEVRHNPAVVFAEINCVQDLHAANVEHRIRAYPYELPLVTYPSSHEGIITLSELWVRIDNGRILLWSERLKKEVIPRLSSAYNHERSHLHVYRFLCDLLHF